MRPPGLKKTQNNEANPEVLQTWTLTQGKRPVTYQSITFLLTWHAISVDSLLVTLWAQSLVSRLNIYVMMSML